MVKRPSGRATRKSGKAPEKKASRASTSRAARHGVKPVADTGLTTRRTAQIARAAAKAEDATCLEMPAAVALVKGCLGGTLPDLGTKLGDLRPDPDARSQFCQCVADGAGVSRGQIPCGEGTTVGEVIDAVAC
jgi:hypothetical protein